MTSKLLLLAGAAALVLSGAVAEPPHGCPPGDHHCSHGGPGGSGGPGGPGMPGGPGGWQAGPGWHGGPGPQGNDWHWQDNHGWHRDHDRYWRPEFGAFVSFDRVFLELRHHHYDRFDGQPYWFHGRFVVRTFDRFGNPIFVEVNPYTGAFIGVVRFAD